MRGQHSHGAISPNFSSASSFFPYPFSLVLKLFSYSWIIFSIGRWIFQTFWFFTYNVFFSLYITARPDDAFQSPWTSFSTAPHPQTERYHTRHSVLCTYPARLISWMFLLWVMMKMGFFLLNYSWVLVVLAVHFTLSGGKTSDMRGSDVLRLVSLSCVSWFVGYWKEGSFWGH